MELLNLELTSLDHILQDWKSDLGLGTSILRGLAALIIVFEHLGTVSFILNEFQSYENQMKGELGGTYINQMSDPSKQFYQLVDDVRSSGQFQQILKAQQLKYHLQPFKIQGIDCEAIRKIYQCIHAKYEVTGQLHSEPNNWNENERRVFIWFIIFYTYFQDISPNQQEADKNLLAKFDWNSLSKTFFNKNKEFLHFQYLSMIKLQGKIHWTQEEDDLLLQAVQQEENGRWNEVAKRIFYNSNFKIFKSPKHCRERWLNHLDNKKKRGEWTSSEDLSIFKYVLEHGKRWCKIVPILNESRTEHMIKNRFNSLLNKQRKSKKQRQEHLCQKVIKIIKKQIINAENRKKIKQSANRTSQNVTQIVKEEEMIEQIIQMSPKNQRDSLTDIKISNERHTQENEQNSAVEASSASPSPLSSIYQQPLINNYGCPFYMQDPYYGFYTPGLQYGYPQQPILQSYYWM